MARTTKRSTPALSREERAAFAHACIAVASSVADGQGFVAIPRLLERFHARLVIRPLLVEGMLATQSGLEKDYAVLVDSERYGVSAREIEAENPNQPLSNRLRFTVAHELAHSLAFRPTEFGIRLEARVDTNEAKDAVVRAVERITNDLTPLLLLSEKALTHFFKAPTVRTAAADIAALGRSAGMSRRALIGGLQAFSVRQIDQVSRYSLQNLAVCIGEWREGHAVIRKWPLFARFERNVLPEFLLRLLNQDRLPLPLAFKADSFAACGGDREEVEISSLAGSAAAPTAEKMTLHCSMEPSARKVGDEFFLVVRRLPLALPVQATAHSRQGP